MQSYDLKLFARSRAGVKLSHEKEQGNRYDAELKLPLKLTLHSYSETTIDARLLIDRRSTTIIVYAKDQSLRAADASLAAYYDEDDESASFMVTWMEDSTVVVEKEEEEDLLSRYRSTVQGSFQHVLDFISAVFARHPTSSEPSGIAYSGDSVIDDPELFGDA